LQTLTGVQHFNVTRRDKSFPVYLVCGFEGGEVYFIPNILSIPDIPVSLNPISAEGDLSRFVHLKGITFPQVANATITLLIRADSLEIFCVTSFVKVPLGKMWLYELYWDCLS